MGNCNSSSEIQQKCTGCGYKKCDCTAGLDKICGRCDPSWKYNIPGTYDAQYNAWLRANPRPVKPVFDPQPQLNSMDFVCTQCTQCQDFSGITAGGGINITDPSQVMTCIGKMQDKAAAEKAAANAAANAANAAANAANAANNNTTAPEKAPPAIGSQNLILLLIIMFVVMMVIIGVVIALVVKGGNYESDQIIV